MLEYSKVSNALDLKMTQAIALEQYLNILESTDLQGPFFKDVLKTSIESVDPLASHFDIKEDSGLTASKIGTKLKEFAKKIWNLILKLLDYGRSFYVKVSGSVARVRKAQTINNTRLARLGNKLTENKITLGNVEKLSINGVFVGDDINALNTLETVTQFFIKDYSKFFNGFSKKISREFANLVESKDVDKSKVRQVVVDIYNQNFKAPKASKEVTNVDGIKVKLSEILPGNRAFQFVDKDLLQRRLKELGDVSTTNLVKELIGLEFKEVHINVPQDIKKEYDVPSINELKQLNNKLGDILSIAEDTKANVKNYDSLRVVVDEAIKDLTDNNSENVEIKSDLINALGAVSKKLSDPSIQYTHWLVITLHTFVLLIRKYIDAYKT